MDRLRVRVPAPHVVLHSDQDEKSDTVQLIGHGTKLHTADCVSGGHGLPPLAGTVTTDRVCVLVPLPHDVEQFENSPQSDTTQSTGQGSVLQGWEDSRLSHWFPPWAGARLTVRVRVWVPPPHDTGQTLYGPHSDNSQCTGHSFSWQSRVSESGGHLAPPLVEACLIVRVRD